MKRSRQADSHVGHGDEHNVGRRSFLRRAGLGSVGALALAGLGDVLVTPAANASQQRARARAAGRLTIMHKSSTSRNCIAISTCHPCSGCCPGGPCKPSGVAYCFYCTATPCGGAGVFCIDHRPVTFTECCG